MVKSYSNRVISLSREGNILVAYSMPPFFSYPTPTFNLFIFLLDSIFTLG